MWGNCRVSAFDLEAGVVELWSLRLDFLTVWDTVTIGVGWICNTLAVWSFVIFCGILREWASADTQLETVSQPVAVGILLWGFDVLKLSALVQVRTIVSLIMAGNEGAVYLFVSIACPWGALGGELDCHNLAQVFCALVERTCVPFECLQASDLLGEHVELFQGTLVALAINVTSAVITQI